MIGYFQLDKRLAKANSSSERTLRPESKEPTGKPLVFLV